MLYTAPRMLVPRPSPSPSLQSLVWFWGDGEGHGMPQCMHMVGSSLCCDPKLLPSVPTLFRILLLPGAQVRDSYATMGTVRDAQVGDKVPHNMSYRA